MKKKKTYSNSTKTEGKALYKIHWHKNIAIIHGDKGAATASWDRNEYIRECKKLKMRRPENMKKWKHI